MDNKKLKQLHEKFLLNEEKKAGVTVHSDYEDGYGPVNVMIHDHKTGKKKEFESDHWHNEDPEDGKYSKSENNEYHDHLKKTHGLSDEHASAVVKHMNKMHTGSNIKDSNEEDYLSSTTQK